MLDKIPLRNAWQSAQRSLHEMSDEMREHMLGEMHDEVREDCPNEWVSFMGGSMVIETLSFYFVRYITMQEC